MTRDEAILKLCKVFPAGRGAYGEFIDAFVALGMLNLEKPKSADERLAEAVSGAFSFDTEPNEMEIFRKHLDNAGLKIVEK